MAAEAELAPALAALAEVVVVILQEQPTLAEVVVAWRATILFALEALMADLV